MPIAGDTIFVDDFDSWGLPDIGHVGLVGHPDYQDVRALGRDA